MISVCMSYIKISDECRSAFSALTVFSVSFQIRPKLARGLHVCSLMMLALVVGVTAPSSTKPDGYVVEETRNSTSLILFHRKCLTKPEVELRKQLDTPSDEDLLMADEEQQQRQLRSIMDDEGFVDDADDIDSIEDIGEVADVNHADEVSMTYSNKLFGGVVVNADGIDDDDEDIDLGDAPKVTRVVSEVELSDKRRRQLEKKRLRTLRRKKRRRRRKNKKKEPADYPPWHCELKTEWLRMPEGYFPQYVQTGKCAQSKCMFGMYQCRAKRYVIRVLRRNPLRCNPIPAVGFNSTYEEAWEVLKYKITICCECSLMHSRTSRTRNRKGNKRKKPKKTRGGGLQPLLPET